MIMHVRNEWLECLVRFHAGGPATQNARLPSCSLVLFYGYEIVMVILSVSLIAKAMMIIIIRLSIYRLQLVSYSSTLYFLYFLGSVVAVAYRSSL